MTLSSLKEPFPATDIEWRFQRSGMRDGKPWALVLAYVTNRAIMDRLDAIVGPESWCNRFEPGPDGGVVCGISIKIGDEWVTKWDGAHNTDVESIKGGLSSAMKRAAVQWGIGRYLYRLSATWAEFHEGGKNRDGIKQDGTDKKRYFKWDAPALPSWAVLAKPAPTPAKQATEQKEIEGAEAAFDSPPAKQEEIF